MSNETATVSCRFCGSSNRFPVEKALLDLTKVVCGNCKEKLLRVSGEPLPGLSADDIAHPWDRDALAKFKAIPYATEILTKVLGSTFDKMKLFEHTSSHLKVSNKQAPKIHRLYLEAAGRLDVDPPPLFIVQHASPNAYTTGAGVPIVGVTTGLIEMMDDRSIVGVLGHELAHVKLGHDRELDRLTVDGATHDDQQRRHVRHGEARALDHQARARHEGGRRHTRDRQRRQDRSTRLGGFARDKSSDPQQ